MPGGCRASVGKRWALTSELKVRPHGHPMARRRRWDTRRGNSCVAFSSKCWTQRGSKVDGGRVAARGFRFQYMRTLEAMIAASDEAHLCRIEGPGRDSTSTDDKEVVDFDLIDNAGRCLVAAQVKSGGSGRTASAHSSFSVLTRLVRSGVSQRYELITNMAPDRQCSALVDALTSAPIPDLREELEKVLSRSERSLHLLHMLSAEELQRLKRARIVFDHRTDAEIRSNLYQCLRSYRNRHRAGMGERSGGLLVGYLLDEIHAKAASETSGWLLSDFRQESLIEDETLLQALGRQDWGAIYGPVVPVPDVNRPSLLEDMETAFPELRDGNIVRTCVLTGLSGIGKSSLASAYLARNAFKYDLILWIEAGSQESLVMSFRKLDAHLTRASNASRTVEDATLVRERVHSLLAALPGRWLMVFDDARSREVFDWLPNLGRGDVLITSTDNAVWSRSDCKISVGSMSIDEATSAGAYVTVPNAYPPATESSRKRSIRWHSPLNVGHWHWNSHAATLKAAVCHLPTLASIFIPSRSVH
ncbi:NB-ARC domain-containing protein [Streptomyces anulatus]|uniref:NB-ARC domain-containing protein n=1 Tax=Streptomyces anulatus TaxID=1892 RepID=UPI00338FD812